MLIGNRDGRRLDRLEQQVPAREQVHHFTGHGRSIVHDGEVGYGWQFDRRQAQECQHGAKGADISGIDPQHGVRAGRERSAAASAAFPAGTS